VTVKHSTSTEKLNNTIVHLDSYATNGSGTATDKWIVDINDALNDVLAGGPPPVILVPPGSYEIQTQVEMQRGIREFDEDNAAGAWTYPVFASPAGTEPHNSRLYAADGIDADLFVFDTSEDMGAGDNVVGGGFSGLYITGNKAGNASGNTIKFVDQPDASNFAGGLIDETIIRRSPESCIHDPGGHLVEWHMSGSIFNRPDYRGLDISGADRLLIQRCEINFCGNHGVQLDTGDSILEQCVFRQNTGKGVVNLGNNNKYEDCQWLNNSTGGDEAQLQSRETSNSYSGYIRHGSNSTDHALIEGNGEEYYLQTEELASVTLGTPMRPKWDGIIFGGPLGGTDIGSVTGADEGDLARADGTTGDADALYIRTPNGDWQALHDPTATITPA